MAALDQVGRKHKFLPDLRRLKLAQRPKFLPLGDTARLRNVASSALIAAERHQNDPKIFLVRQRFLP
jgi:hypothetical protein